MSLNGSPKPSYDIILESVKTARLWMSTRSHPPKFLTVKNQNPVSCTYDHTPFWESIIALASMFSQQNTFYHVNTLLIPHCSYNSTDKCGKV